ncbi:hypothetical protein [Actomonas aquatica]|uniref:Uncharacterized protein n=1 Tax=Actomonas aquatica TaxID=2866162 RepID=A0ABZ1C9Q2_9BACT|nr:hypothetical protein [Opitutus sp. WL0086]WRQ88324.1 hypothetical protein K1X11_002835 [Opitutus sp. WL0086]
MNQLLREDPRIRVRKTPAPFAPQSGYDSGWWVIDNRHHQNVSFDHGLGVIPTRVAMLFSPDMETVFHLPGSWNVGNTSNPVSVWMTDKSMTMAFAANYPLHARWDASTSEWIYWHHGFLRVVLGP